MVCVRVRIVGSTIMLPYEATLDSWGFLSDYRAQRKKLIGLAKDVYEIMCFMYRGQAPNLRQCYDLYWKRLNTHVLYLRLVRSKPHLSPQFYEVFAQMLAWYVLTNHWSSISVPCP
jgi:hypothetical protein